MAAPQSGVDAQHILSQGVYDDFKNLINQLPGASFHVDAVYNLAPVLSQKPTLGAGQTAPLLTHTGGHDWLNTNQANVLASWCP